MDTSSQSAGCALLEDSRLLGEFFTNVKLTHSQTILPMVQNLLDQTHTALSEVDLFAVTTGPGSFTGLRIGLSAVKGMAHALGKPCVGVSTLEALAFQFWGQEMLVAPVLDARCAQVYTALFRWEGETLDWLEPDQAIPIAQLEQRLKNEKKAVFLVGDGAEMCYNMLNERLPLLRLAPPTLRYTHAGALALAAQRAARLGYTVSAEQLAPAYLRLPQAERELLAKQQSV